MIKIRKPKESANTLDGGGRFPFLDGRKFNRVHFDLSLSDYHAKEFDMWHVKSALGEFEGQSMLTKGKQDSLGTFVMKGKVSLGMDAQVVHIDLQPTFSNHIGKDVIHKQLKSGWPIAEPKEHNSGFKEPERGDERSFPLVFLANVDVVESPLDIELGKDSGVFHVVN